MSLNVKETTEQFLSLFQQTYINCEGTDNPENLIDELIGREYPGADPDAVSHALLVNSAKARQEKIDRKLASEVEKWIKVGQMDLFGSGEFKIPPAYLPKSIAEAERYMADKAIEEQAQADELAKAAKRQQQRAFEIEAYAIELGKLKQGVLQRGMNPDEVSVEQAIKAASEVQQFAAA